jgi:hypothetical protein
LLPGKARKGLPGTVHREVPRCLLFQQPHRRIIEEMLARKGQRFHNPTLA